jgi:phage tail-like protein
MTQIETASGASGIGLSGLDPAAPGGALTALPGQDSAGLAVSHVPDRFRCYIGDPLTLYTRVEARDAVPGFTLQISLPPEFTVGQYSASANQGGSLPDLVFANDLRYLVWRVDRMVDAGERFEYELHATVNHAAQDFTVESTAMVLAGSNGTRRQISESVEIAVRAKSHYLQYLPALYYDDDLMGRFLMIFESFWQPIEQQIDGIHYYFDSKMTPSDFLPWLASWTDLALDDRWTEAQQRRLLGSAARLFRMRGTRQGLVEYLEIYTGRRAVITEHRANNLRLGRDAKFGPSVALGRDNKPHSFTIHLRLPPASLAEGEDEAVRKRKEHDRRRTIASIIESEKPAHTSYTLIVENEDE